ncbi:MAG: lytic transglycosylase domain-containing protein [Cyanobacteria bacterium REEB65]|nr:lytic transglycosylase domain-containing protein [Cyanobacteria bacterium REEB65]
MDDSPLNDVEQVLDRIQQISARFVPVAPPGPKSGASGAFGSLLDSVAASNHLDPKLVQAVMQAESGGDPTATSQKGAMGLMQLMPETAKDLGVQDPYDPAQNLQGGAKFLRQMLDQFGNVPEALAAYNAGPNAVTKYGGIPPYSETQHYVREVLDRYRQNLGK